MKKAPPTLLSVYAEHPQPRKIAMAVDVLRRGGVIAYPTDTVYAIGCDIRQKKAMDRLYDIKRMPRSKPLAFVCENLGNIAHYAVVEDWQYRIMKHLLPGPYCFILPATREVPKLLMMKRKTVGIRVPDHRVTQNLVSELGNPVVSSTVTWEDEAIMDPQEIAVRYPQLDLVLDAGWGGYLPSTVVSLAGDGPEILRQGAGAVDYLVGR